MLNSVDGWLATKRTDGVFCGTLFGKTTTVFHISQTEPK